MSPIFPRLPPLMLALAATTWIILQVMSYGQTPMPASSLPFMAAAPSERMPEETPTVSDYRPLTRWNLFPIATASQSENRDVPHAGQITTPPRRPLPTPLKLSLRGVLLLPETGSVAFVRDAAGHERGYRIGEMLPGEAHITTIESRQLLLRHAGRLETLRLSRTQPEDLQATSSGKTPRRVVAVTPRGSGIRR